MSPVTPGRNFMQRFGILILICLVMTLLGVIERGYYAIGSEVIVFFFGVPILGAIYLEEKETLERQRNRRTRRSY